MEEQKKTTQNNEESTKVTPENENVEVVQEEVSLTEDEQQELDELNSKKDSPISYKIVGRDEDKDPIYKIQVDLSKVELDSAGVPVLDHKDVDRLIKAGYVDEDTFRIMINTAKSTIKSYDEAVEALSNSEDEDERKMLQEEVESLKESKEESINLLASYQITARQDIQEIINSGALSKLISASTISQFTAFVLKNHVEALNVTLDEKAENEAVENIRKQGVIASLYSDKIKGFNKETRTSYMSLKFLKQRAVDHYTMCAILANKEGPRNIMFLQQLPATVLEVIRCFVEKDLENRIMLEFDKASGFKNVYLENKEYFDNTYKAYVNVKKQFAELAHENLVFARDLVEGTQAVLDEQARVEKQIQKALANVKDEDKPGIIGSSHKLYKKIVENTVYTNFLNSSKEFLNNVDKMDCDDKFVNEIMNSMFMNITHNVIGFDILKRLLNYQTFFNESMESQPFGEESVKFLVTDLIMNSFILRECKEGESAFDYVKSKTEKYVYKADMTLLKSMDVNLARLNLMKSVLDTAIRVYYDLIDYFEEKTKKMFREKEKKNNKADKAKAKEAHRISISKKRKENKRKKELAKKEKFGK